MKPRVSHALRYAICMPQVIHHLNMRDALTHRPRPMGEHPASYSQLQQPLQDHHISRCSHHTTRGPGELTTRSTTSTVTDQGHRATQSRKVDTSAATYSHESSAVSFATYSRYQIRRARTTRRYAERTTQRPTNDRSFSGVHTVCIIRLAAQRADFRIPFAGRITSDVHSSNSRSRSH